MCRGSDPFICRAEETGLNSDAMDESGKSTSEKTPTETFLHQRAPSKEWNEGEHWLSGFWKQFTNYLVIFVLMSYLFSLQL